MKKLISFVGRGAIAVATAALIFTNSSWGQKLYTVKRVESPPTIDGLLTQGEWDAVSMEGSWGLLNQPESAVDQLGWSFAATWDDDNMYMLFTSTYDDWLSGTGSSYQNQSCDLVLQCFTPDFGGNPDGLNLYFDPNINDDPNIDPPDGYHIAIGINEGSASYVDDAVTNTFVFREAHVDVGFGNNGAWGQGDFDGHAIWSFVSHADENGAVIEMVFPWQTWDAMSAQIKSTVAPENGDEWFFNAGVITSDPANRYPTWNWNSSPSFVTRPDGVFAFSTDLVGDNGLLGDFDGSGALDEADVNLLSEAIQSASEDTQFDLNDDGTVTTSDLTVWIKDLRVTYFGDTNLDGEFNSSDFVITFQSGKYETGERATWAQGDWNASGIFDTSDFVLAFQDGGYEQGPAAAVSAVPEPACASMLLLGVLSVLRRRRR